MRTRSGSAAPDIVPAVTTTAPSQGTEANGGSAPAGPVPEPSRSAVRPRSRAAPARPRRRRNGRTIQDCAARQRQISRHASQSRPVRHPADRRLLPPRQLPRCACASGCAAGRLSTRSTASPTCTRSRSPQDPAVLRRRTRVVGGAADRAGLDPERCTLFVQSHVPEHAELSWVLELHHRLRRGQPDDAVQGQVGQGGPSSASVGLFTYPILMAADILLYRPTRCRSARTSASTSSSPATWRSGSTAGSARRSWCPAPTSCGDGEDRSTCRSRRPR